MMVCEDGGCSAPISDDFDLIMLHDILESHINNQCVNGWVHLDLSIEEVQMLLKLVEAKLDR